MKLLVDLGNSRLKWAWWDGRRLHDYGCMEHGGAIPDAFRTILGDGHPVDGVFVSSVASPSMNRALHAMVSQVLSIGCRFLESPASAKGVRNAYAEPDTLGPDRWAAIMGAWSQQLVPACVVDCGTAVTVDVLDDQGTHRGGVIFAGLRLSREALGKGTHRLTASGEGLLPVLASDTGTAIRTGTLQALTGAVDYLIRQVAREIEATPTVLITGGDADLVAPRLDAHCPIVQSDLVLRGLAVMAEVD